MTVQEFARLGGKARARALSKKRLREIARKAGLASGRVRKLQAVAREFKAKEIASAMRAGLKPDMFSEKRGP